MSAYTPQAWDNTNPLATTKAKTADAEFREIKKYLTAIPQISFNADRTLAPADAGQHFYHPTSDTTARTITIPANASVAIRIGAAFNLYNDTSAGVVTLQPAVGVTLVKAGSGPQANIAVAAHGSVMLLKVGTDRWVATGVGMT